MGRGVATTPYNSILLYVLPSKPMCLESLSAWQWKPKDWRRRGRVLKTTTARCHQLIGVGGLPWEVVPPRAEFVA